MPKQTTTSPKLKEPEFFSISAPLCRFIGIWPLTPERKIYKFIWKNVYISYLIPILMTIVLILQCRYSTLADQWYYTVSTILKIIKLALFLWKWEQYRKFLLQLSDWYDEGNCNEFVNDEFLNNSLH